MVVLEFWVMFVVLGLFLQAQVLNSQNLTCNSNDLKALQGFLIGLGSNFVGWDTNSSSNCCDWVGITCNSSSSLGMNDPVDSGRVVKLQLGKQRLTGTISESLGQLDQLRTLNLSHNFLQGLVPASLLHLPNLEVLDLSYNDLSSLAPVNISLPSIKHFDISENSIRDRLPVGICKNSIQLQYISFAVNYFHGDIPAGFGNCSSLEHLCFASNLLSGGIPEDIFQLPKLLRLSLQDNKLSGQLSPRIGNLSNLDRLDISMNGFSGSLPDNNFANLRYFSAQSNYFKGRIPFSLANSQTLTSLSLRNNSLEGPIALNCSAMTRLVSLDLASNQFSGSIPENLPICPQLKTINLARNYFSGQIPESFKNFQSLSYLSISNSSIYNLKAALGILQHCQNLSTLVIASNFHGEELPSDPSLQFSSLKALIIANCRLTGLIPQWLSGSTQLQ